MQWLQWYYHVTCSLCFQTNLMILYLEAVNYKVVTALATLEGHPPAASNTFSQHIETTRDKNGHQMSVLKVRTHANPEHRSLPPTESYRTVGDSFTKYFYTLLTRYWATTKNEMKWLTAPEIGPYYIYSLTKITRDLITWINSMFTHLFYFIHSIKLRNYYLIKKKYPRNIIHSRL